ncbi:Peptidase S9 prolyl oligopeptidase catalytic domain [Trinorchestia longiramus]|nr:Peptidase S9 prolyl oligopeptidase catalytic domain [Trinorchestia longiramus]
MTEALLTLYRSVARMPDLKSAYLAPCGLVESVWSNRNLVTLKHMESVCSQRVVNLTPTSPTYTPLLDNVQLIGRWRSSRAWLVQKEELAGEKKATRYIYVQRPESPPTTIDLSNSKLHGKVYADGELGCLAFSPDGTQLAFVAEQYTAKGKSFLDASDGHEGRGDLYLSLPDWGEQFTGKCRSVVVIVPVAGDGVSDEERVMLTPPEWCAGVGQLQWTGPDELVGVAYVDASPRLGLIYCRIRESVLFHVSLRDKVFRELTPRGDFVGSPRLTPTGASLVYLRGPTGGPHVREAQLLVRPWGPEPQISIVTPRVVIDTVSEAVPLQDGTLFPGLTGASSLPLRCFLTSDLLVFSTQTHFTNRSFVVCIETGSIAVVGPDGGGSVVALDAIEGRVLCSQSSFTASASLCLAPVSVRRHEGKLTVEEFEWVELVKGFRLEGVADDWLDTWLLMDKPSHPDAQYNSVPVPVFYCGPQQAAQDGSKRPLVSLLHGGPHSAYSNSFQLMIGVLLSAGFSLVIPNYRGSLGVGSSGIHSLLGHVGSVDVNDCHAAVLECLKRHESVVDRSNVYLCGGSHGGYLVTSLSAKHPDFYRAVSTRNPVTDIATMAGVTDIPDWTHVEAGSVAPYTSPPPTDVLTKMAAVSPMWVIDAVRAPTLLLLGTEDRRVPLSQGMKYHQLLRHRGVPTRVHVYPDCHALSKVDVELDCLMHTLTWFTEHRL